MHFHLYNHEDNLAAMDLDAAMERPKDMPIPSPEGIKESSDRVIRAPVLHRTRNIYNALADEQYHKQIPAGKLNAQMSEHTSTYTDLVPL